MYVYKNNSKKTYIKSFYFENNQNNNVIEYKFKKQIYIIYLIYFNYFLFLFG